jgi:hypothetical protein
MVAIKSGGGITSNQLKQSKAYKTEPKPHAMSPAGVAQQGMATAFKKEPLEAGPGYRTGPQQPTGIAGARKGPAGAGPGGMGRTIYASGSQMMHGKLSLHHRRHQGIFCRSSARNAARDNGG